MMTVFELIRSFKQELPKSEIEYLLTGLLKKNRHELYATRLLISESFLIKFKQLVQARKKGTPLQYLLKTTPFLDFELYVNERVFIPRPETEELATKTIAKLVSPELIIEIGTGSGAIAIALAKAFPAAKIFATDIAPEALAVAQININRYNLNHQINLVNADLFQFPEVISRKLGLNSVDCIISNPPYIDQAIIPILSPTVRDYEPRQSLDGGKNGFEIIRKILCQGLKFLKPNGLIALEIAPEQKELILNIMPQASFENDLAGYVRFAFIENK